uniref:GP78 n=1 Tax=Caviid herpesvirus 2 str. CIDMTR TaxID=1415526 RepID=U6H6R6_9BETA|nr:GP78 [Caviid herpesvirus 2 str. CIDMTR]
MATTAATTTVLTVVHRLSLAETLARNYSYFYIPIVPQSFQIWVVPSAVFFSVLYVITLYKRRFSDAGSVVSIGIMAGWFTSLLANAVLQVPVYRDFGFSDKTCKTLLFMDDIGSYACVLQFIYMIVDMIYATIHPRFDRKTFTAVTTMQACALCWVTAAFLAAPSGIVSVSTRQLGSRAACTVPLTHSTLVMTIKISFAGCVPLLLTIPLCAEVAYAERRSDRYPQLGVAVLHHILMFLFHAPYPIVRAVRAVYGDFRDPPGILDYAETVSEGLQLARLAVIPMIVTLFAEPGSLGKAMRDGSSFVLGLLRWLVSLVREKRADVVAKVVHAVKALLLKQLLGCESRKWPTGHDKCFVHYEVPSNSPSIVDEEEGEEEGSRCDSVVTAECGISDQTETAPSPDVSVAFEPDCVKP